MTLRPVHHPAIAPAADPTAAGCPLLTEPKRRADFKFTVSQASKVTAELDRLGVFYHSAALTESRTLVQVWVESVPAVKRLVPEARSQAVRFNAADTAWFLVQDNRFLLQQHATRSMKNAENPTSTTATVPPVRPRTEAEITDLIDQWRSDPSWDLKDTEGFEAHRERLAAAQEAQEAIWAKASKARQQRKANELGVPDNLKLARYVLTLEHQIERLEARIERMENPPGR